jgi:hypothetical protein
VLEENSIQGLYPAKGAHQSFWFLLLKIELAFFREHKKKEVKQKHE